VTQGEHVRVLVVDDHALSRDAMSAAVTETAGFVLVGAVASGEQSIAANATLRPDLVLMDVNMPGMGGIEASSQLTNTPAAPIVLLISTYAEAEVDYRDCGAAGYLSKSAVEPDRLSAEWTLHGR
jgi:DNA-binding NarL/FixJ family response regulator